MTGRGRRGSSRNIILNTITWVIVLLMIFPIYWMIITSLKTNDEVVRGDTRMFTFIPQFQNYVELWQTINFFGYFKNSLIISGLATVFATLFAMFAGYALARFRFRGSGIFSMGITATQMIPGMMFLLPIYLLYLKVNEWFGIPMINTFWGMVIIYTAFYTPMSIWIMRSFFVSIPRELEDAARIDGCSPFMAFVRVIMPLSLPGVIATATFAFLAAWDELLFAWVLTTTPDVQTIPVGIRLYVGQYQNRFDLLMAAATVTTIPVMIAFFATQRYFIRGMTAGAVKG
ncbi:carbohydrate ABC transporter permease [Thermicanus aegyptius]|uniref:carbohydrate ABC transporter permease n=1 Tax=Thermicanus aegyptius TaxID=94009 RepID=UPI000405B4A0|nr:carbohydrate ABC transporter permease [Thermicanus aegyptius]